MRSNIQIFVCACTFNVEMPMCRLGCATSTRHSHTWIYIMYFICVTIKNSSPSSVVSFDWSSWLTNARREIQFSADARDIILYTYIVLMHVFTYTYERSNRSLHYWQSEETDAAFFYFHHFNIYYTSSETERGKKIHMDEYLDA